jgi:hypothetical protein
MVDEMKLDVTAQLFLWKGVNGRAFKRLRKELASEQLFRLPSSGSITVQEEYQRLTKTSVFCVLEMYTKRKQKRYRDDPPDVRSKRFEALRKKYSLLLAQVMIGADLPVVSVVQALDDPQSGWIHLFAARRGNTLKNRYKAWKPFERWLEVHRGSGYPRDVKDAIDYVQRRVDDGCGRTIPEALSAALGLLEQLGRVVEGSKISDDPLW